VALPFDRKTTWRQQRLARFESPPHKGMDRILLVFQGV
jgi:hypothetical protein